MRAMLPGRWPRCSIGWHVRNWLPSEEDRAYVASLMGRVVEPGKMANWIAPPPVGINRQPIEFEYVRFN